MSDKWQPINLRLEAPLAQALRDMKQGHEEPLSEVILRLLWKAVRQQNPLGGRGAPGARSRAKAGGGRGGFGADRRGKAAPRGRAAGAAGGKGRRPFVPREAPAAAEWGDDGGKRAAGGSEPPRAPRKFGGKPFRPQPQGGGGEAPKRAFRARPEGPRAPRARDEADVTERRPRRPAKAKATRPRKG